jgi:hypothetical protein
MNLANNEAYQSNHLGLVIGVVLHKLRWLEVFATIVRAFALLNGDGL